MTQEYTVTWQIDEEADSRQEAAEQAWMAMSSADSIANVFLVTDEYGMSTTIDLSDNSETDVSWTPSNGDLADLAEWMAAEQWDFSEITEMIRRPHKYADEFSKMVIEREFSKVACEPEEIEEEIPQCARHGGPWGGDETCEDCTDDTGRARPVRSGERTEEMPSRDDVPLSSILVRFHPEAWIDDHAVEVQTDWDQDTWYVSESTAAAIFNALAEKRGHDWDWIREEPEALIWCQNWSGPFTIEILPDGHRFSEGALHKVCERCGNLEYEHSDYADHH